MRKVLVAIDFSRTDGNEACIKAAQSIAEAMNASLVFLNVIEPVPGYVLGEVPEWILDKRNTDAEEELGKLAAEYGCTDTVIRTGAPATEILEHASEINADVIVLHSHDPDLSDYFLGSVASRVVRHAHCSVHIVRNV